MNIKTAILGCTGLIGQQLIRLLENHPYFKVETITSSCHFGKKYGDVANWVISENIPEYARDMVVQENDVKYLENLGVKIVFSALPSTVAKIEKTLRGSGMFVFSNASLHRMDNDVPILIPEINAEHINLVNVQKKKYGGAIITSSNCTVSGLTMVLKPLLQFGIKGVYLSTYQSISGAGRKDLPSIDILGNIIPFIENEEEKIVIESNKILGSLSNELIELSDMNILVTCCRVPVRDGHLQSLIIEFNSEINEADVYFALKNFYGIPQKLKLPTAPTQPLAIKYEPNRPQPIFDVNAGFPDRAKGMTVTIGRIRLKKRFLSLVLLVNNTIRGAAGTCILNAELVHVSKFI